LSQECIIDAGDRGGVSRITIKKFAEEKYKLQPTPAVTSNINRSIAFGAEKGIFVLPKGMSHFGDISNDSCFWQGPPARFARRWPFTSLCLRLV
jgi:hypothetical protein